jgi:PHD/YefM family antitoxin component YafN of YafNO toxin-antitoxin module
VCTIGTVIGSEKGTIMNVITVAEIKRSGFAALDAALAQGPVHLMKRNRPSAVLLSPADYAALLAQAQRNQPSASSGLSQFLAPDADAGGLDAAGLQARLAGLNDGWSDR